MTELARVDMPSPVGRLTLVAGEVGLRAVLWETERPDRIALGPIRERATHPVLRAARDQLVRYFAGDLSRFDLPLEPGGTPFQRRVWAALMRIPFGETRSYAAIAAAIGEPKAVRAVGAANGRNPIAIVIPCHRVVGATGALTGFAGGLAIKERLLTHEGARPAVQPDLFGEPVLAR